MGLFLLWSAAPDRAPEQEQPHARRRKGVGDLGAGRRAQGDARQRPREPGALGALQPDHRGQQGGGLQQCGQGVVACDRAGELERISGEQQSAGDQGAPLRRPHPALQGVDQRQLAKREGGICQPQGQERPAARQDGQWPGQPELQRRLQIGEVGEGSRMAGQGEGADILAFVVVDRQAQGDRREDRRGRRQGQGGAAPRRDVSGRGGRR